MSTREEKLQALLKTAYAYKERGYYVQYDQLSTDRVAGISARRNAYEPPQAALPGHFVFLDCSSFCFACYYHTFGYRLESDLTWHMIDVCKPRVFYKKWTHAETPEEIETVKSELRKTLTPGDIVVFQLENGNGHALLVANADEYINCTQRYGFNGYDYKNRRNVFLKEGGVHVEKIANLFGENPETTDGRHDLFAEKILRFCVIRPLDVVEDPISVTERPVFTDNDYQDLITCVTNRNGANAVDSAAAWYRGKGLPFRKGPAKRALTDLFCLHDGCAGDILSRLYNDPSLDLCAPGLYGGYGVIAPENVTGAPRKINYICKENLQTGDLILAADDALFEKAYGCFYDGKTLTGSFEYGEAERTISGEEMDVFIDSLFGRFVFAVLRP